MDCYWKCWHWLVGFQEAPWDVCVQLASFCQGTVLWLLCKSLSINLENGTDGVPPAGVDDWLEEQFGGVIEYIAEMFLEISKVKFVSQYMSSLSGRISMIISNTAVRKHVSKEQLAKDWLNEIKSNRNHLSCLRDAGLCGSLFSSFITQIGWTELDR